MENSRARALRRQGVSIPEALVTPHPSRAEGVGVRALSAHAAAVAGGADGYVDPTTGLFCFTAAHHWDKGACCELGCRHCPWLDADLRMAGPGDEDGPAIG